MGEAPSALLVRSLLGPGLGVVFAEIGFERQSVLSLAGKGRLAIGEMLPQAQGFLAMTQTHSLGSICLGPSVWPHDTTRRARDTKANHMVCLSLHHES